RRREDTDDRWRREGGGGVDPEARVRVDAPHEGHVEHPDQAHILDERGLAAQEPRVLQPLVRLSEEWAGHGRRHPPISWRPRERKRAVVRRPRYLAGGL